MPPDPPNAHIASLFDELADLYELDGAVVHRVLAYRNAAKSVREAPRSVAAMTREGKVTELPGIGRTLEEKIEALIDTGTIPAVEKLRARIPAGLVDLTRLPGLGPKRARKLYDELGIDSLESLRAAAEGGKLRDVRGFGQKFEESVLAAFAAGAPDAPRAQIEAIRTLDESLEGIRVLIGTETNIGVDGRPDYDDDLLAQLDWVIASVHTSFSMDPTAMTDRMVAAIEHPLVDAIGHPTGRKIEKRAPYAIDMDRVIEAAARTGTMIEINSAPDRRDLNDVNARAAVQAGVRIVINSDAHGADTLIHTRWGVAT